MTRRCQESCWNCGAPTLWGVFCVDCVRAFVLGAMGVAGAAFFKRYF